MLECMEVIGLQFDIAWEDKPANFATVNHLLERAAPSRGALVVLPEMFATGFSMNTARIAEPHGGPTEEFLANASRRFGIWLLAGAALHGPDGHVRNQALVFSPEGRLAADYAKMRPFTPGGEPDHYIPGLRPTRFQCGSCVVAPFICYDLRFPELFREVAAAAQPELYVVIANWPEKRILHWVRLLQARAIENQAFVMGVNRIGRDPHYAYGGRSVIVEPQGDILEDAGPAEVVIRASLELDGLREYRAGLPFLADLKLHAGGAT
jgi:predicted amidohydrolase